MSHLKMAKLFLGKEADNTREDYQLAGVTHALVAIAETNENRLNNELEMTARLHIICELFIKLTEQLEKIAYRGHYCASCHDVPVEEEDFLCDTCLNREDL